MKTNANSLLVDIRELTVYLHNEPLEERDHQYLRIIRDSLRQIRRGGSPGYPFWTHLEKQHDIDLSTAIEAAKDAND